MGKNFVTTHYRHTANFLLFIMGSVFSNFYCVSVKPVDKAMRIIYVPTSETGQFIFQRLCLSDVV